jgi:hypothetical protein
MEAETISKNGASLKSLMSKGNLLKRSFLFFFSFCLGMTSTLAQDNATPITSQPNIQSHVQQQVPISYAAFSQLRKNDDEMGAFLKENDDVLYRQFDIGTSFGQKGKALLNVGIFVMVVVTPIAAAAVSDDNPERKSLLSAISVCGVIAGSSLVITGIPLCAVGGDLKRRAANGYEKKYFSNRISYQPSLNFQITENGVGLALNF